MSELNDAFDEYAEESNVFLAKLFEHMEWENTLPDEEKHKRRLAKGIGQLPRAAQLASQYKTPWLFLGQLERVVAHAKALFGDDCLERAAADRQSFYEAEDDAEPHRCQGCGCEISDECDWCGECLCEEDGL